MLYSLSFPILFCELPDLGRHDPCPVNAFQNLRTGMRPRPPEKTLGTEQNQMKVDEKRVS